MTVLITLTTAGTDTGPFNLYSNLDSFVVPFETNVNKAALQAGYTSSLVPDITTTIRVKSVGACPTQVDIVLNSAPPLPEVPCGSTASSGFTGITNVSVNLNPAGGLVIFEVDGQGVPDKFEIIHAGVKKATSGMTVANSGPFDNVYGTPPANLIPTQPQTLPINQFIGTDKLPTVIPTRDTAFASDTGIGYIIVESGFQQLVWWKYTAIDYTIADTAILRITGTVGTSWEVKRLCETTTTTSSSSTTSTSSTSSTTTTTTTATPVAFFNIAGPFADGASACPVVSSFPINVKSFCLLLGVGCIVYTPFNIPFAGGGNWYQQQLTGVVFQVNGSGVITGVFPC